MPNHGFNYLSGVTTSQCMSHFCYIHKVKCAFFKNGLHNNETEIKDTIENQRVATYLALSIDTDTDSQYQSRIYID